MWCTQTIYHYGKDLKYREHQCPYQSHLDNENLRKRSGFALPISMGDKKIQCNCRNNDYGSRCGKKDRCAKRVELGNGNSAWNIAWTKFTLDAKFFVDRTEHRKYTQNDPARHGHPDPIREIDPVKPPAQDIDDD